MARLDELCALNMGQSPDSSSYNEIGEGLPFFQGNADFGVLHPKVRVWCDAPTKIAHPGDILISVRAPIGAMNIADRECCIGRGLAALTVDENLCSRRYIWYAIGNKVDELNAKGTGSTFKAISKNILGATDIPLPSHNKQCHIAAVLDKLTHLISLRKQQLAKLDEVVKARFVEMFGDPVQNTKNFPLRMGQDIFKLSSGKPVPEEKRFQKGIPAYGGNGISWYTDEALFYQDTLVIGRVGFQSGNVHFVESPLWVTDNAMYVTQYSTDEYNLYFLYALMEQIDFTRFQDAGDLKKITQKPFMKTSYICPPLDIQTGFVGFVEQTNEFRLTIQQSLDKMEILKKALMQEYFG